MGRHSKRRAREGEHHQSEPRTNPVQVDRETRLRGPDDSPFVLDECNDDRPPVGPVTEPLPAPSAGADAQDNDPGAVLRRARETRGLTIADLTRLTKVSTATLTALEHNDVLRLPAAVFTRGFLKAYAREVGLDPDHTADEYLAAIEPIASHHLLVDDGMLPPVKSSADAVVPVHDDARHVLAEQQVRRFGRFATIAAVLGFVLYIWSYTWPSQPPTASDVLVDAAPSTDATRTGGRGETTNDAAAANADSSPDRAAVPTGPLRFELHPQGPCWLSANVDGTQVVAKLLQAGDRQTLEASESLVLRVGDPGALSLSINGLAARPLGRPGQPVNVRITKENFREFLSAQL